MELVLVLTVTLVFLPIISVLTSELDSLPTDFFGASLALLVTAAGLLNSLVVHAQVGTIYENAILFFSLFILWFVLFALICIGSYIYYRKINDEPSRFFHHLSYAISLFFGCLLILLTVAHVLNVETIYQEKWGTSGEVFNILSTVFSQNVFNWSFGSICVIFITCLLVKYGVFKHHKTR